MKIIFVFFVCCLAVVFANPADKEEDRMRETAFKECQEELKISDEEARDSKQEGCVLACMHKKVGYYKVDGTLNIERITQGSSDQVLLAKMREIFQMCEEKAKGDSCVLAYCLEKTRLP